MENSVVEKDTKSEENDILQGALDILQEEDGKSFEEKKGVLLAFLREDEMLDEDGKQSMAAEMARCKEIKGRFWATGDVQTEDSSMILRPVCESDREGFIELKWAYPGIQSMLRDEYFREMLWEEHISEKLLVLSITYDGEYIGYCGINDLTCDVWEISIELKPEWTGRGMGMAALTAMLDAIKLRLAVNRFKVLIEPTNYASQRTFERLGAAPKGIADLWIHSPERQEQIEEESLHLIDEKLTVVAEKFGVAPRKLLSHVLEYRLDWE